MVGLAGVRAWARDKNINWKGAIFVMLAVLATSAFIAWIYWHGHEHPASVEMEQKIARSIGRDTGKTVTSVRCDPRVETLDSPRDYELQCFVQFADGATYTSHAEIVTRRNNPSRYRWSEP